jgi:DNA-binding phage protein
VAIKYLFFELSYFTAMKSHQALAELLRKTLAEKHMTQARLREEAGLSSRTLQHVLSGKNDFKLSTLFAVADRLGLELVLVPQEAASSIEAGALSQPTPPVVQSRTDVAMERLKQRGTFRGS